MTRPTIIAGNWKMHLTKRRCTALARAAAQSWGGADGVRCLLFPPFPYIEAVRRAVRGTGVEVGAQNCHESKQGAYTGEVSADMLRDIKVDMVLIGHSERRHVFGETDDRLAAKVKEALKRKLNVMFCVGETMQQREADQTAAVLTHQTLAAIKVLKPDQISRFSLAYEPVWAIGTGLTATPQLAQEAHALIRGLVRDQLGAEAADSMPILYGGSVKGANAAELLACPDIDGALVGGASLKIDAFAPILEAAKS